MLLILLGCATCRGELSAPDGALSAGESVEFAMTWSGESVDPCAVLWFVDEIEGGDAAVGTITDCGRYTAPTSPPAEDPVILGAEFAPGTCADCCPAASGMIALVR
ncbi:MAG: hypothetical protein ACI8RZ_000109 [Myxococcota bacterium]|jgi:hypothetical protein